MATPETETARQMIHYGAVDEREIVLPIGWEAITLGATEIRDRLAGSTTVGLDAAAQTLLEATDDETRILVAAFTGSRAVDTPQPIMTVSVFPRHNLKLNRYIEEFATGLDAVSDMQVVRAGLLYDVRTDGAPVGIVAYQLPPTIGNANRVGYHLVQFDAGGENLVAMTWVASADVIESTLGDIHASAATVGPPSPNP